MAKVAISLPDSLLAAIEQLRRKTGETRSEFLRRAARSAMDRELERQWDEEYEEAYRKFPEDLFVGSEAMKRALLAGGSGAPPGR